MYENNVFIGALTNKHFAFQNRSWELDSINSVDILDSLGSNIKVYIYGSEIKRILPLKNDTINEDWISNKTRFFFEALKKWRINMPLIRKNKFLIYSSWKKSFYFFALNIWFYSFHYKIQYLSLILDSLLDYELVVTTKLLSNLLGMHLYNDKNINDFYLFYINPFFYKNLEKKKIFIYLGLNLRLESPILNIKLRKNILKENIIYCSIGVNFNDNLKTKSLGLNIKNLLNFLKGKKKFNFYLLKNLKQLSNNNLLFDNLNITNNLLFFIISNNCIYYKDYKNIYNLLIQYTKNINILFNNNYINKSLNIISYWYFEKIKNSLNFLRLKNLINFNINIIFLNLTTYLKQDLNLKKIYIISKTPIIYNINNNFPKIKSLFNIYQGHQINNNWFNIDILFSNLTFLEKSSNFLNVEGNLFYANKVLSGPFSSKNDWSIINALYLYMLNFTLKLYNFKVKFNKFDLKHLYICIKKKKKLILFLKNISINFYYREITKNQKYFFNEIIFSKKINDHYKLFEKIIYNVNILSLKNFNVLNKHLIQIR